MKFGYNFSNKGTIYLIDALEIICCNNDYLKIMSNLDKNIYPIISKKYNSNKKTIKSDIIKATNNMCKIRDSIPSECSLLKYTPKIIIYYIVDKIKNTENLKMKM